jgi:hypothetical protein
MLYIYITRISHTTLNRRCVSSVDTCNYDNRCLTFLRSGRLITNSEPYQVTATYKERPGLLSIFLSFPPEDSLQHHLSSHSSPAVSGLFFGFPN